MLQVYTKTQAWSLVEYERVVFMDADQLVLQNIDEIMLLPLIHGFAGLLPTRLRSSCTIFCQPAPHDWASKAYMNESYQRPHVGLEQRNPARFLFVPKGRPKCCNKLMET